MSKPGHTRIPATRVHLGEAYEIGDWTRKLGASEVRIRAAIAKVGDLTDDVERELHGVKVVPAA